MAAARLHVTVRSAEGLTLLGGPPFKSADNLQRISCSGSFFSNDGSKLAVITPSAIAVYDPVTCKEIRSLGLEGVVAAVFSPCGTYIQAFQKPRGQEKNAGIWDVSTGDAVFQFFHKSFSKSNWPIIQFSDDETVACRLATNDVQIFDAKDFGKGIVDHLRVPGVQAARLSFSPPSFVATYVPESKGQPAVLQILDRKQGSQVARKSFFKSSSVNMMWNRGSAALLVMATSDDDKSNQSYYGESRLHFLKSDGSQEGVPLNKEGPIHDAQWSPTGKEFIVIYGYMPAMATLFDLKCRALFSFGSGPYNTVRWNPFGSFVCLGGFGNLPGDMSIWDRGALKLLGNTKSPCSVTCEWSPDGRMIMTATTAPRLQVDNGMKIFKYNGALVEETKIEKLYQAEWQPGEFTERPASPVAVKLQVPKQGATAATKPAAYRPPNSSMSSAVRSQLFGEEENNSGELSKSALKNKKRREKQKQKAEEPALVVGDATDNSAEPTAASGGDDDVGKKLRALNKKLRQIEELKMKVGVEAASEAQKKKLDQEGLVREEIAKLEESARVSSGR